MSRKRYWRGLRYTRGGGRGRLYLLLYCHHQNDPALRWATMTAILMSNYEGRIYIYSHQTSEIKSREVSWTLTKKLDAFAGRGEIKRREVVLDRQVSPEEIKSREVLLG